MTSTLECVVISMPARIDRRTAVTQNMAGFQYPWQFFDACVGDSPSPWRIDEKRSIKLYGRPLLSGEIGCAKSHLAVIRQFCDHSTSDWLLVFEDDVWVDCDFDFADLAALCERNAIGYIRLYARNWKKAVHLGVWRARTIVRFLSDPYGAQGYLINRRAAREFLASISAIELPIDDEFGRFWVNGLVPYAVFPFPIIERESPSSLEAGRVAHDRRLPLRGQITRISSKIRKTWANARFRLTHPPLNL